MVRIDDETDLVPLKHSPVLQRLGLVNVNDLDDKQNPVKAGEWVRQRVIKNLAPTSTEKGDNNERDVEIVKGVKIRYFD